MVTDDICSNYHGGADTSVAAHNSIVESKATQQLRIHRAISRMEDRGATCDEVEVALGLRHQTASARITELSTSGMLVDTGLRRATRSGRSARVYVARRTS